MDKLFLDTNIILDLVSPRPPFSKFAQKLFSKSQKSKIRIFQSKRVYKSYENKYW